MRESQMSPFLKEIHEALESTKGDVFSIKIVKEDDDTFDIRIWDERGNESCEGIEEGYFKTYDTAQKRLTEIIAEHPDATFIRSKDEL